MQTINTIFAFAYITIQQLLRKDTQEKHKKIQKKTSGFLKFIRFQQVNTCVQNISARIGLQLMYAHRPTSDIYLKFIPKVDACMK